MANNGGKDGCALNTTSVPAGPVTFTVANTNAPGITEVELLRDQRIIGEKENLAPGLDPVSFTVTLDGGSYQLYCPGAATEYQSLTVTGRAPAPPSGHGGEHPQPRHQGLRGLHRRPDRSAQRRREGARRRRAVGKPRRRESGLRQGAAVLGACGVHRGGLPAAGLRSRRQRGQPRLSDRHACVHPGRRQSRVEGFPRHRTRPVAGRRDHPRHQGVEHRIGRQRRQIERPPSPPCNTSPRIWPTAPAI